MHCQSAIWDKIHIFSIKFQEKLKKNSALSKKVRKKVAQANIVATIIDGEEVYKA